MALIWAVAAVALVIMFAVVGWYLYRRVFRPRLLAEKILQAKAAHREYDGTCDMLFGEDPYLAGEYDRMKAHRPRLEVLNLCANQAKHVLKRK